MKTIPTQPAGAARRQALDRVSSTHAALRGTCRSKEPLADVRAAFAAAADAVDGALHVSRASAHPNWPLIHQLDTARDRLILQRRDTHGVDVPDCAQTASLDAEGPPISGLNFDGIDPHDPGTQRVYGLDLTAALEPATRAAAGQAGPYAHHRRHPPPRWR